MRMIASIALFLSAFALADLPEFASPFYIQADGRDIDIKDSMVDPTVADLDGDGIKDLLVGTRDYGRIYCYHNDGTNANPVFTYSGYLKTADGRIICMASG